MAKQQEMLPEEIKRVETFNEMSKPLQKVAEDFAKKESAAAKGIIGIRYDMGAKLRDVIAEEATYGSNAVQQLAKFLGKTETELYTYNNVASTYNRDEVIELSQKQMALGGFISWNHLTAIVEIKHGKDRKKMWERVFAESLSATTVKSEALASMERGNSRGLGGGRTPSKPSSPLAGCQQIYKNAFAINNRVTVWQESVFDAVDAAEPDVIDPMYVEKIKLALDEVETLSGNLSNMQDRLQKNLKRATNIVEKHTKAAEKEAEKGAETENNDEAPAEEGKGGKKTKKRVGRRRPVAAA